MAFLLREWRPDPEIDFLLRGASSSRSAGASFFIFAGLTYSWISIYISGGPPPNLFFFIVAFAIIELLLIVTLARFRGRIPWSSRKATYDDTKVNELAASIGRSSPEVRIEKRNRHSVRVRGLGSKPAIVVSPLSMLVWERRDDEQTVQVAHEMGHVWTNDLRRSIYLSTATVVVAAQVLFHTLTSYTPNPLLPLTATGLAIMSLRSFLRSREHAADFFAAQVLGERSLAALERASAQETRLPRLLSSHPTPRQRRRVFADTTLLFGGIRLSLFTVGYCAIYAVDAATEIYNFATGNTAPLLSLNLMLWPAALTVGWIIGGLLASGGVLCRRREQFSWFASMMSGSVLYMTVAVHSQVAYFAAVLSLAVIPLAGLAMVALTAFTSSLVKESDTPPTRRARFYLSISPCVLWAGFVVMYASFGRQAVLWLAVLLSSIAV